MGAGFSHHRALGRDAWGRASTEFLSAWQDRERELYDQTLKLRERLQALTGKTDISLDPARVRLKMKEKDELVDKLEKEIKVAPRHY